MSIKIGFIVNPIAGLGGKKAWKGTDLISEAWEYFEKGEHYSFEREKKALSSISTDLPLVFLYCANPMGEEVLQDFSFKKELVFSPSSARTSAKDTQKACEIFIEKEVDLILFVGGDGTARDVASIVGDIIPVLGIPSGVKMFSGCFLYRPTDLGEIMEEIVSEHVIYAAEDIMDVNEELFRENKVQATLFGQMIVPQKSGLIQGGKIASTITSIETYNSMAEELVEEQKILEGITILGTGSTVYHILKAVNIEKTLLGVDVLINGRLQFTDVDEETLYSIAKDQDIQVILTPIGGQGFLLGRGNQQISSRVLVNAKSFSFIIVSSEQKLQTIDKLQLDIDKKITIPQIKNGFVKVLTAFHQYSLKKINI